jgi:hypothetical protein
MFKLSTIAASLGISDNDRRVGGTGVFSQPPVSDGQGVTLPRRTLHGFPLTKREAHFPASRKPEQRAAQSYEAPLVGRTRCQDPNKDEAAPSAFIIRATLHICFLRLQMS